MQMKNKDVEYPLPVVKVNSVGKLEDNHTRMKGMNEEEQGNVIVSTHPQEDMDTLRIY